MLIMEKEKNNEQTTLATLCTYWRFNREKNCSSYSGLQCFVRTCHVHAL